MRTSAPGRLLTAFIGRERELAELETLLGETRLLTLRGPGGVGKSRLAQALVDRAARAGRVRTFWVSVAPVLEPGLFAQDVAEAVGCLLPAERGPWDAVARKLASSSAILVLDDCDPVAEEAGAPLERLLEACPRLTVLVTSREPLRLAGEHLWDVPGMSLPPARAATTEDLVQSDAGRLFLERARDARPDFEPDVGDCAAVGRICRRLDGLPLALELAAARVRSMSPSAIEARLDDALALITGERRGGHERHRTLAATVEWSHRLLGEDERTLLRRLSVFRAGATLDAIEEVCADGSLPSARLLEALLALADRSLVSLSETAAGGRYVLSEVVRLYALDRLRESDDGLEVLHRRHASYYLARAESAAKAAPAGGGAPLAQIDAEAENLRGALRWSRVEAPDLWQRLAMALSWYWVDSGRWQEGAHWLDGVLSASSAVAEVPARVLAARAGLAYLLRDDPTATEMGRSAVRRWTQTGDGPALARGLAVLAQVLAESDDWREAERASERSVALARDSGDGWLLGWSLACRAAALRTLGRAEEADHAYREAEAEMRRAPAPSRWMLEVPLGRAFVALGGDVPGAAEHALAAVRGARGLSIPWYAQRALLAAAAVAASAGSRPVAAGLLRAVAEVDPGAPLLPHESEHYERLSATLHDTGVGVPPASSDPLRDAQSYLEGLVASATTGGGGARGPAGAVSGGSADLSVRALGPLEVEVPAPSAGELEWQYAKPRELLVYLLVHRPGRTREQIAADFWPEASSVRAKNNVHVALHRIRRVLGDRGWVVHHDGRYLLNPARIVDFDVERFETGVRVAMSDLARGGGVRGRAEGLQDRLRAALDLYRGDLLNGADVGDWHLPRRETLAKLFVRGQLALAGSLLEAGMIEEARDAFERVLEVDDLSEEAYRGRILCHARLHDRAGALRIFQSLERHLLEHVGSGPSADTRALVDRVRREEPV